MPWPILEPPTEMDKDWMRFIGHTNHLIDCINKLETIVDAARELCEVASPITYTPEELARMPKEQIIEAWQNLHDQQAKVTTYKQMRTPLSKKKNREIFDLAYVLYRQRNPHDTRPMEEVFAGMPGLEPQGNPEA